MIGAIITLGFGTFAGVKYLPTLGYLTNANTTVISRIRRAPHRQVVQ